MVADVLRAVGKGASTGGTGVIVTSGVEDCSSLFGEDSKLSDAVETREILEPLLRKLGSLL